MKTEWINHNQPNLIVYFAGWGTPISAVQHLTLPEKTDLLICYDYQDLTLDFDFSRYQNIHIVAWSMGVWVANQVMKKVMKNIPFISATAINGTGLPCHDEFGIPVTIFKGTLESLNEANRTKFERRMCGDKGNFQHYQQLPNARPLTEIQAELTALDRLIEQKQHSAIPWTKAIIGSQDRIFPTQQQQHYWQQMSPNIKIILKDTAHYCLSEFQSWQELCDFTG